MGASPVHSNTPQFHPSAILLHSSDSPVHSSAIPVPFHYISVTSQSVPMPFQGISIHPSLHQYISGPSHCTSVQPRALLVYSSSPQFHPSASQHHAVEFQCVPVSFQCSPSHYIPMTHFILMPPSQLSFILAQPSDTSVHSNTAQFHPSISQCYSRAYQYTPVSPGASQ